MLARADGPTSYEILNFYGDDQCTDATYISREVAELKNPCYMVDDRYYDLSCGVYKVFDSGATTCDGEDFTLVEDGGSDGPPVPPACFPSHQSGMWTHINCDTFTDSPKAVVTLLYQSSCADSDLEAAFRGPVLELGVCSAAGADSYNVAAQGDGVFVVQHWKNNACSGDAAATFTTGSNSCYDGPEVSAISTTAMARKITVLGLTSAPTGAPTTSVPTSAPVTRVPTSAPGTTTTSAPGTATTSAPGTSKPTTSDATTPQTAASAAAAAVLAATVAAVAF